MSNRAKFSTCFYKKNFFWIKSVGWVALFFYSFFWLISSSIAKPAETIFIVCSLILLFLERDRRVYVYILLLLSFLLIQILAHYNYFNIFSGVGSSEIEHDRHFLKLFLCILAAYWIKGSTKAIYYLAIVAVAGFLVSLVFKSTFHEWQAGFYGRRVGFDYVNIQHTAVFFGLSLIASMFGLLGGLENRNAAQVIICVVVGFICFSGVYITQTRAVWLALMVVLFIAGLFSFLYFFRRGKLVNTKAIMAFIFISFAAYTCFYSVFEKRDFLENSTAYSVINIFKEDRKNIVLDSAGTRLYLWSYAADKIKEKPLIGWGSESRFYLLKDEILPLEMRGKYQHFHNSYLELLVAYGFFGFVILALLTSQIIRGCFSLIKKENFYLGVGLLCSWMFFLIVNIFESYIIFSTARFFFFIFGGVALSYYLYQDKV